MKHSAAGICLGLCDFFCICFVAFLLAAATASAQSVFTIEDPPVDCEVVDADPFDGIGDNGPYSTFNDALLGTLGECRSMAEFDISPFAVPPGEYISSATFEVRVTALEIYGLGVNGENPECLVTDGYVGNGIEELSDFQAGDGNVLDIVDTPDLYIGQIISFDVTPFVTELVELQETYVGLTIRAGTFGGLWVTEGNGYPKLIIETEPAGSVAQQTDPSPGLLLQPNVPNPFTAGTRIDYTVRTESGTPIVLTIHDASGRLVRTLHDPVPGSGAHSVFWDGTDSRGASLPGGAYFCRLRWEGSSETIPLLLVR